MSKTKPADASSAAPPAAPETKPETPAAPPPAATETKPAAPAKTVVTPDPPAVRTVAHTPISGAIASDEKPKSDDRVLKSDFRDQREAEADAELRQRHQAHGNTAPVDPAAAKPAQ